MKLFVFLTFLAIATAQNYKGTATTTNSRCRILGGWTKFSGRAELDVQISSTVNEMLIMYIITGSPCVYGESDPANAVQYKASLEYKREKNFFEEYSAAKSEIFQSTNATYLITGKFDNVCVALCQTNPLNISDFDVKYTFVMKDYEEIAFQSTSQLLYGRYCYKLAETKSSTGVVAQVKINTQKPFNLILETGMKCGFDYTTEPFNTDWNVYNNTYLKPYNRFPNSTFQETITIPHLLDSSYCYYACMRDSVTVTFLHYTISMNPRPDLEKITLGNVEEAILVSYEKVSTNATQKIVNDAVAASETRLADDYEDLEKKLEIAIIIASVAVAISVMSTSFFIYLYVKGK